MNPTVCPECGAVYHEARRPLISVLMAFGIGVLIGKLIGPINQGVEAPPPPLAP